MVTELQADPLALLRTRTSGKWRIYPDDVLPLWLAEMDYPLAEPIAARLADMVARSDTGYNARPRAFGESFADFAGEWWGWHPDPHQVRGITDATTGIVELVRHLAGDGGRIIVTSPVYPPFFESIDEGGGVAVDVPLVQWTPTRWRLDLDGIERELRAGAVAVLLCHPHNPIGHVHPREELAALAELAQRFGALVLSDEVHAPLTHSDAEFVPFLAVSEAAADVGVCITAASKGWNIAGLKAAFYLTTPASAAAERVKAVPAAVHTRLSHPGVQATIAAYSQARPWLRDVVATLELQRARLRALLDEHLPAAVLHEPHAGYLAWIDFSALGWGDDPARHTLKQAKVALNRGPTFGPSGAGFARLNFATSPEVLEEAIRRIAAV